MTTWLNASFEVRFRFIGALTVRFAASEDRGDHALLLSPWPESLLAFEPVWWRLAQRTHLVAVDLPGFCTPQLRSAEAPAVVPNGGYARGDRNEGTLRNVTVLK